VAAGRVTVDGAPADKASRQVAPGEQVAVLGPRPRYVSRGGDKLSGAIEQFGIDPAGQRWLDAGASTGGFTDCLLQRGCRAVVAVDVGRGQLHERLRADPRVEGWERTHLRDLTPELVGGPVDGVVADLSFISLRKVVGPLLGIATPGAPLVLLVKPQFEAGREEAARGRGVIRDPEVWARVLHEVIDALTAGGATIMGMMVSPLRGADGNVEFFVHVSAPGRAAPDAVARASVEAMIDDVVSRADQDDAP
jgi:23S rRNA (cytidine1920-2'-O)/16S rRNA (cytidine1409-2'-O)-methyltransferase